MKPEARSLTFLPSWISTRVNCPSSGSIKCFEVFAFSDCFRSNKDGFDATGAADQQLNTLRRIDDAHDLLCLLLAICILVVCLEDEVKFII
ncbi:hypothetical protein Sjap_015928 [Stephania japonica]|uniref:Uncharacterized protein n=1 Tax=Stephania japonica TaxID=461633 RepID=A0AAP0NUG1_9MAGN